MSVRDHFFERGSVHVSYDHEDVEYHRVIADRIRRYVPGGGRILEVGPGAGNIFRLLRGDAGTSWDLAAADIDPVCLAILRETVSDDIDTRVLPEDRFSLDGFDAPFDAIVMSHVLEHIPHSPVDVVRHALARLTERGVLILAVPNPVRPHVIVGNLVRRHYVNPGHVVSWDPSHWRNFLEAWVGAEVVEYPADEVRIVPGRIKRIPGIGAPVRWAERHVARALPWFAYSNMAVLRKS
ncbi:MAG TPA: class I SAM-dependent methyltransferase [Longimicrobiales bacterium]|nr:class I SAM-dependent methyltransferase [Longimicrobiales bacterium]